MSTSPKSSTNGKPTDGNTGNKSKSASGSQKKNGKGLADLFVHGIKDMYYAEKKIYKALPKMIKLETLPSSSLAKPWSTTRSIAMAVSMPSPRS